MKNFKRGFTLVEMLIVIAIVSILVMFIVVSIRESQMRSRDARRIAEVNQIAKSILAYQSATGKLPALDPDASDYLGCSASGINNWDTGNIHNPQTDKFLSALITDNITQELPKEKSNSIPTPVSGWPNFHCSYAYTKLQLNCTDCSGEYGVLYGICEGTTCPVGEKTCCKGQWSQGEGDADKRDMIYFFKE